MEFVAPIKSQKQNVKIKGPITLLSLVFLDFMIVLTAIDIISLGFNSRLIDFTELFILPGIHGFRILDFIWITTATLSLYANFYWTTYMNWRKIDRYFIIISLLIILYFYLSLFTNVIH